MSEPRYTLEEAERELAFRQCAELGHVWEILQSVEAGPLALVCDLCGWSGDVRMDPRPSSADGKTEGALATQGKGTGARTSKPTGETGDHSCDQNHGTRWH